MNRSVCAVALLMCVALIAFAGGQQQKSQQADSKSGYAADPNVNQQLGALPILKSPEKSKPFTIAISNYPERVTQPNDLPQIKRMMAETGLRFEWTNIPTNGIIEKINLLLASGQLPDAFWDCITDEMIVQYLDQDVFIQTEDLAQKYMPNFSKILEKRPVYKARATAPNGHRYGFPYIEEMYGLVLTPGPFLINKVWLDKVGKKVPTTVDEWVDCLRAFKTAGDLNGNGKADEIPYAYGFGAQDTFGSLDTFNLFCAAFGQTNTAGGNRPEDNMAVKDGKVIFTAANPAYKETAKFFNSLYKEGLIDIDSFSPHPTPSSALYVDKIKSPDAVIGSFGVWAPMNMIPNAKVRDQYVPVPRLKGSRGKTGHALNFTEMQNVARFAITRSCDRPEILARFVDYMYSPEISITANWGSLGFVMDKGTDGKLHYRMGPDKRPLIAAPWKNIQELAANTRGSKGATAVLNEYYETYCDYAWDAVDLLAYQKVNGKEEILAEAQILPRMLKTVAEQSTISQIQPQIKNIVESNRMNWILKGSADATWDQYLKDLDAAGLNKLLAAFQSAYDRYQAAMKK
jgi:putative aldouronate transport system substrate-binding protein